MVNSKMASRGFLVSDGALRRKNDRNKPAKRQSKTVQRKKNKPEWDDTVTDLKVYKPTQDELRRRHEAHKSKNVGLMNTLQDKENQSIVNAPDSTTKRKQAILQEILYGQDKFQSVLAETDMSMSAVKDLFGDDPKKYLGFPNVTVAPPRPENTSERFISGPFAEVPETPTHLSMLSDSIMQTPALNELSDRSDSESSEDDNHSTEDTEQGVPYTTAFEPQLDLQRYRQLISHESANKESYKVEKVKPTNKQNHVAVPKMDKKEVSVDITSTDQLSNVKYSSQTPHDGTPFSSNINATDTSNAQSIYRNDSIPHVKSTGVPTSVDHIPSNDRETIIQSKVAIKDARKEDKPKRQSQHSDTSVSSATSSLRSLEDLKKMVEGLEDEIAEYEMETGREPSTTTPQTSRNFSGYTSSLIMAVTKLMRYLKETETQRKAEAILRDQILQGFSEQRTLVDALTNDIFQTQEQNMKLQNELHLYKQSTDNQLNYLKRELETVLKSFEYHTVQSTINTLHSTKPIPLNTPSQDQAYTSGNVPTTQGSQRHVGRQDHITEAAFIPVSAVSKEDGILNHKEVSSNANGTQQAIHRHTHTYNPTGPHNTYNPRIQQSNMYNITTQQPTIDQGFQPQQVIISGPIIQTRQQTHTTGPDNTLFTGGTAISTCAPNQHIWDNVVKTQANNRVQADPNNTTMSSDRRTIHGLTNGQHDGNSLNANPSGNHNNGLDCQETVEKNPASLPSQGCTQGQTNALPKEPTQDCPGFNSSDLTSNGSQTNTLSSVNEDSMLVKSMIKDPQATRELRNRLQGIALKQRNIAAMRAGSITSVDRKTARENSQDQDVHQPSPHVHFKLPKDVKKLHPSRRTSSGLPEKSPSVSPIPHQELDVPAVQTSGLRKGKHVVVNLPSVWSDVSSTISVE